LIASVGRSRCPAGRSRPGVGCPLLQRSPERGDLAQRVGHALADRLDHGLHQLPAAGLVGFAVGGDDALEDPPGRLDLDVLVGREQAGQPPALPVGE